MRLTIKQLLGSAAILCLSVPMWGRSERTYTAEWTATGTTTVQNTQIMPGTYMLKARQDQKTLDIIQDGKVIAEVPCHWVQLPKKAENTEVDSNHNQIVQVEFAGSNEAIQVE